MTHDDEHHHDHAHDQHPKDRPLASDDPMLLNGVEVDGDPLLMLDAVVQEYARMGWDNQMIQRMFDDPFYVGPYGVNRALGRDAVRRRIEEVLGRCGTLHFRTIVYDEESPDVQTGENQQTFVPLTIGGRRAVATQES